jgi:hypothetical protein
LARTTKTAALNRDQCIQSYYYPRFEHQFYSATMSFAQLPDELLQLVFQYLSTQQRLQVAAQVCQRFKKLANATEVISVKLTGHRREKLGDWLSTNCWTVRTLRAVAAEGEEGRWHGPLKAEPLLHIIHCLTQLDRLDLTRFDVPTAAGCVEDLSSSTKTLKKSLVRSYGLEPN